MKPEMEEVQMGKVLVLASVASMVDQFNMPNIRIMQKMGYEVHVACNFLEGNTCSASRIRAFRRMLSDMHVVQHPWDCPRNIRPVRKCLAAYGQIRRLLAKHRFAWVHCHSPVGGVLARLAAYEAGVPVIYTAHGFHFYKGAPVLNWLLYYPAEKWLARRTKVLITVNGEDYKLAKGRFQADRIYRIPGVGIDLGRFSDYAGKGACRREFCRKYSIPEHAKILLSVGELSRRKNHQVVIHALAGLQAYDVYYMVCGQGACKEHLLRQAGRLGILERVRLLGFQEDIVDFYRHTDIFVFPSVQEGMPVALMEAMAAGMPCVVSDIRGNRELMGKTGDVCFPCKDAGSLRKILACLLEDEHRCRVLSGRNKEKIKAYGIGAVSGKMEEIYRQM